MHFLIAYSSWNIYKSLCFGMHLLHIWSVLFNEVLKTLLTHAVAEGGALENTKADGFSSFQCPLPPTTKNKIPKHLEFRNSFYLSPAPLPFVPICHARTSETAHFYCVDPIHPSRPDSNMTSFRKPCWMLPDRIQNTFLGAGPVCSSVGEWLAYVRL